MLVLISLSVLIEYTLFAEELKCFMYKLNVCPQKTLLCKSFIKLRTVIPKCVLLIWSFKWFLNEDLHLYLSHFSIPSCAGKDLDCPARNPYHSPQTLQSFSAINLNVHKLFIWNLYFNVVLHLIFSGILMPNISSSCFSDLRTVSIIFFSFAST